jgi:hypothetical protein
VTAFCTAELVYVFDRVALPITTRQGSLPDVRRDWIDAAVPGDASVALVPNPVLKPDYWWDAELWNKRADRVVQTQGTTYTPFPAAQLTLDSTTGAMRGLPPTTYFVLTTAESRFGFAAVTTVVRAPPLVLVRVPRPQAAQWATSGASPDGWTFRSRPVMLRVFAAGSPGLYGVAIKLSAPPGATSRLPFTLETGGATRKVRLAPESAMRVDLSVCVPEARPGAAMLVSRGAARIPDGRTVGVHIDSIETVPSGKACAAP